MRDTSHFFINNMPVTLGVVRKACWESSTAIRSRWKAKNRLKIKETQVEMLQAPVLGCKVVSCLMSKSDSVWLEGQSQC